MAETNDYILMIGADGKPQRVKPQDEDAARNAGFETAAKMRSKEGAQQFVKQSHIRTAQEQGFVPEQEYQNKNNKAELDVGPVGTAVQQAGSALGFGAAPVLAGAYSGAKSLVKGQGLETALDQYRLGRDIQKGSQEASSEANPLASKIGTGLGIGAGLLAPIGAARGAVTAATEAAPQALSWLSKAGTAAKAGALPGAGFGAAGELIGGNADLTKGELGKAAMETGAGALGGAAIGGALGGLSSAIPDAIGGIGNLAKGFKTGATEAHADFKKTGIPGLDAVRSGIHSAKGGIQGIKKQNELNELFTKAAVPTSEVQQPQSTEDILAGIMNKVQGGATPEPAAPSGSTDDLLASIMGKVKGGAPAEGGDLSSLQNSMKTYQDKGLYKDEAEKLSKAYGLDKAKLLNTLETGAGGDIVGLGSKITPAQPTDLAESLFSGGQSKAKDLYANQAAESAPGRINADDLKGMLAKTPEQRMEARNFDPVEAGKDLVNDVRNMKSQFKQGVGSKFGELQNQAAAGFDVKNADKALNSIDQTRKGLEGFKEFSKQGVLEDVQNLIRTGAEIPERGITRGTAAEGTQMYPRLQMAREMVDGELRTAAKGSVNFNALKRVRDSLDETLKTAPGKTEADAIYSKAKGVMNNLFGSLEMGTKNAKEIDPYKIAKNLGSSDTARRTQDAFTDLSKFLESKEAQTLPKETLDYMRNTQQKFMKYTDLAKDKKIISGLEYAQGPSSAAVERLGGALNKQGLHESFATAPGNTLNAADKSLTRVAKETFGDTYSNLTPDRQKKVRDFLMWTMQNKTATQAEMLAAQNKILGGK